MHLRAPREVSSVEDPDVKRRRAAVVKQVTEGVSSGIISSGSPEVLPVRDHHRKRVAYREAVSSPQQKGSQLGDLYGNLIPNLGFLAPLCHGGEKIGGVRDGPRLRQIFPPVSSPGRAPNMHAQRQGRAPVFQG